MSSETYHEAPELLTEPTKDMHRALRSLMEELEAIDWYQQRVDASKDVALREVLAHNKREEIEHAMMVLEWIRRNDPVFDANAQKYLFRAGSILEAEAAEKTTPDAAVADGAVTDESLGIGSLRESRTP
jgi:ferritin-like protein